MCETCGCGGNRRKKKHKFRDKKKHPYKKGGRMRSIDVSKQ